MIPGAAYGPFCDGLERGEQLGEVFSGANGAYLMIPFDAAAPDLHRREEEIGDVLARAVAGRLGAEAVITTATDAVGLAAIDQLIGFAATGDVAAVTAARLDGRGVSLLFGARHHALHGQSRRWLSGALRAQDA